MDERRDRAQSSGDIVSIGGLLAMISCFDRCRQAVVVLIGNPASEDSVLGH